MQKRYVALLFLSISTLCLMIFLLTQKTEKIVTNSQAKAINQPSHITPPVKPTNEIEEKVATPSMMKNQIKLGVAVENYSNNDNALVDIERKLSYPISTISIFIQFGNPYNNQLNIEKLTYAKSNNKKLLIAWEPWNPNEGNKQTIDYLKGINNGDFDLYIHNFARSIRDYTSPVTLRFGHEMNGDWYPWGKRPQEYINAYRRIHNIFNQEQVSNIQFMWSINASPLTNIDSYYPGNDIVDQIGIDGFNFGTTQPTSTWASFKQIFYPSYQHIVSRYPKPIIISETASTEIGGDKAEWIKTMLEDLTLTFPKVEEIIWFNILKEADWRIDSSEKSLNSFSNWINSL
ncbi:MAG TPA: glycosyl hydrolase [Candidatus Nitrosocosmicus sp.]|nr:glycosyl hydrolase [Candidatus Nitrosocosmicus sp.]